MERARRMHESLRAAVGSVRDQGGPGDEGPEGFEGLVVTAMEAVEDDIDSLSDFDCCSELAWQVADLMLQGVEFEAIADLVGQG